MNKIVIDSSAWIEYFAGSGKGMKVRDFIEREDSRLFVTESIVGEVIITFMKQKVAYADAFAAIQSLASLVSADYRLGADAALICIRSRLNLSDAYLVAAARATSGKLLTCDAHFSGISEAIIIK